MVKGTIVFNLSIYDEMLLYYLCTCISKSFSENCCISLAIPHTNEAFEIACEVLVSEQTEVRIRCISL